MFHLSLPVESFSACLDFYKTYFGAEIVMLSERAANLFVFDGQLTFHDKPNTQLGNARREMHFGHVVSEQEWFEIRGRVKELASSILSCVEPKDSSSGRGKLLLVDPSGNVVEINSKLPA